MTVYTPTKQKLDTQIDKIGARLGMIRFENESETNYRRRVLLEIRDPTTLARESFYRHPGRFVGEFDKKVLSIDLLVETADPVVVVTPNSLKLYSDYENEVLDAEFFFDKNNEEFLIDILVGIAPLANFSAITLDEYENYLKSNKLRPGTNLKVVKAEKLKASRSNKLEFGRIRDLYAYEAELFEKEVTAPSGIVNDGEYSIDYFEGVVFTKENPSRHVSYTYRSFPFTLHYQPVRLTELFHEDYSDLFYDQIIDDETGLLVHQLLNSFGAKIINDLYDVHQIGWGK